MSNLPGPHDHLTWPPCQTIAMHDGTCLGLLPPFSRLLRFLRKTLTTSIFSGTPNLNCKHLANIFLKNNLLPTSGCRNLRGEWLIAKIPIEWPMKKIKRKHVDPEGKQRVMWGKFQQKRQRKIVYPPKS